MKEKAKQISMNLCLAYTQFTSWPGNQLYCDFCTLDSWGES